MEGPGADSGEKHEPASDIDTAWMDSLKVLDPEGPIREADICVSRHMRSRSACLKGAMNGLMRSSKRHLYSITLSARPSSEGGTARSSALAVLRLTISSDFVGACTHLGLPYESHRLQAPDRKGSTSEVQE
jgi:hypothetical protein